MQGGRTRQRERERESVMHKKKKKKKTDEIHEQLRKELTTKDGCCRARCTRFKRHCFLVLTSKPKPVGDQMPMQRAHSEVIQRGSSEHNVCMKLHCTFTPCEPKAFIFRRTLGPRTRRPLGRL